MNFYIAPDGIISWRGSGRPVRVVAAAANVDVVIRVVADLAVMLGVSEARIKKTADAGATIQSALCPLVFTLSWATEEDLRTHFPDALITKMPPHILPRPCTIHYRGPGIREDVDMRTMTETRHFLGLTRRQWAAVVNKAPGYRSFLPRGVAGVTVRAPNWRPKTPFRLSTPASPMWNVHAVANGLRCTLINGHPQTFPCLRDLPSEILSSCVFV